MTEAAALRLMTRLDVRRRDGGLRCPHVRLQKGNAARNQTVVLWDRDRRQPISGHPAWAIGWLCWDCAAVYRSVVPS